MSKSSNKHKKFQRTYFVSKISTIPAALLLMLWGFILVYIVWGFATNLMLLMFAQFHPAVGYIISGVLYTALALIILYIHKKWISPKFEGCLKGGSIKNEYLVLIPMAVLLVYDVASIFIFGKIGLPDASAINAILQTGFCENAVFIGIPVSYMIFRHLTATKPTTNKEFFLYLITAAVPFGALYLLNMGNGLAISRVLLQVLVSIFIGGYYAAVFMRTGNLWPCILGHMLHTLIMLLDVSERTDKGIMIGTTLGTQGIIDLVVMLLLFLSAFYLVRPKKQDVILKTWGDKFPTHSVIR